MCPSGIFLPGVHAREGLSKRRPLDHATGQGTELEKHEGKPLNADGSAGASNNTAKGGREETRDVGGNDNFIKLSRGLERGKKRITGEK